MHVDGEYMTYQFSFGLAFLCIPVSYYLSKRLGVLFGVLSAYVSIQSFSLIMNMHGRYKEIPDLQNSVSINAAFSLLICGALLFGLLHTPGKWLQAFRVTIPLYTVCNALYVIRSAFIGFRLPGGHGYTGLLDYAGMSGTLMALGTAFLIPKETDTKAARNLRLLGLGISITGIILSKSAIPYGVLGVVITSRLISQSGISVSSLLPLGAALALGGFFVGSKMVNSSGRFQAYRVFLTYLYEAKMYVFGTGLGSLKVFAPTVQINSNFMMEETEKGVRGWVWTRLHSDFLESLFQLGIIGFLLVVLVYLYALIRAFLSRDSELFSLGIGLGAAASLNYPLHYFSTAFLAVYFVVSALEIQVVERDQTKN